MNNTQRLQYLFQKQLAASATEAEQQELFMLSNDPENEPILRDLMDESWNDLENSRPQPFPKKSVTRRLWFSISAAAAVTAIAFGTYFWMNKTGKPPASAPVAKTHDVAPGKEGAILTLPDGRQIVLDDMQNGSTIQENGVKLIVQNGQLTYDNNAGTGNTALAWHTMSTPRGRQFQLRLPDGSSVWLNAASTIRYPAAFVANERKVELTGEAYFEVSRDQQRPFRVVTPKQQIEVMGTHFNVNAYADEPREQTTLIEGSVKVSGTMSQLSKLLTPDQQASVTDGTVTISKVDTEPVTAWKNGLFCFVNANVPGVMRQLSRWYDIDVQYEGQIPDRIFRGKMQRDLTLNEMLHFLSSLNLNFKLEGEKKLIVKP